MIQGELPLAVVKGEQLVTLPEDLYIPPDALEVFLEAFSGPLDLLLYLIRRQNFDICDIPVAHVTEQYMAYVELMREFKLDLAADYLVMAAMLAEIKSRLLLPRQEALTPEEDDPRAALMKQLQAYEQCRQAALDLDALPRLEREHWPVQTVADFPRPAPPVPQVALRELLLACQEIMRRADLSLHHEISREALSVRERMTTVLARLAEGGRPLAFARLLLADEGRQGAVVTLLAVLELLKAQLIDVMQGEGNPATLYVLLPARPA